MEYRRLGKSGLKVSVLSLGSWLTFGKQISDYTADQLMGIAYDAGVNFFDNAETYAEGKSEEVMGQILKNKNWDRSSYVVSSKVFFGAEAKGPNQVGLSRKHVMEACDAALKRLQLEYLDLYYCHRPDPETPVEETVWAMNTLIQQGKIFYWGTSEWSAAQIMEAFAVAKQYNLIGPTMEQPQYNMFERFKMEKDYLPVFEEYGLGTTIWSPLASGLLSGKYSNGDTSNTRMEIQGLEWLKDLALTEEKLGKVNQLHALANDLDIGMPHFALAWCLKNPNVSSVILGASKTAQLEENLKALDALPKLSPEVMEKVEIILQNKP